VRGNERQVALYTTVLRPPNPSENVLSENTRLTRIKIPSEVPKKSRSISQGV
jgi:hypothetical protein